MHLNAMIITVHSDDAMLRFDCDQGQKHKDVTMKYVLASSGLATSFNVADRIKNSRGWLAGAVQQDVQSGLMHRQDRLGFPL
jgi:hypothetical protein